MRYSNLDEALNGDNRPIELTSELVIDREYVINDNGPYRYDGRSEDGAFKFHDVNNDDTVDLLEAELDGLIKDKKVHAHRKGQEGPRATENDTPHLDKFTRNTFGQETSTLWDSRNVRDQFSPTDLLDIDQTVRSSGLHEMPMTDDPNYEVLIALPGWKQFKKYMLAISPDLDLPDGLG